LTVSLSPAAAKRKTVFGGGIHQAQAYPLSPANFERIGILRRETVYEVERVEDVAGVHASHHPTAGAPQFFKGVIWGSRGAVEPVVEHEGVLAVVVKPFVLRFDDERTVEAPIQL